MYIKMVGDTTKYQGKLERVGIHLIKVSGLIQNTTGFRLYLDNDVLVGDYSTFIYPYLDPDLGEGIYEYSDNNMDYEEETQKPSKEEQEENKIVDIVNKHWSEDLDSISMQLVEMQEISIAMYETLINIAERFDELDSKGQVIEDDIEIPSEDEPIEQPVEEIPTEEEEEEEVETENEVVEEPTEEATDDINEEEEESTDSDLNTEGE